MEHIFIENNPEQILADTIARYQSELGDVLNAADPERLLINCMAYRETILRSRMEHVMRQNFVQYATAPALDRWGELFGIIRNEGESDDSYRNRILKNDHLAIGTIGAYRNRILDVAGVSDVMLRRKIEDTTLPPGITRITPIMLNTNSIGITSGCPHNIALENSIIESIHADNFGIIGAEFIFSKAMPVAINGSLVVRKIIGEDSSTVINNINNTLDVYFGSISLKFDSIFGVFDLERAVAATIGVMNVIDIVFENVPEKRLYEYYQKGKVNITLE